MQYSIYKRFLFKTFSTRIFGVTVGTTLVMATIPAKLVGIGALKSGTRDRQPECPQIIWNALVLGMLNAG
jgi:hypothetical protein